MSLRAEPASPGPSCPRPEAGGEPCPRCGATMIWLHASVQCPVCKYKEGCCG